MLKNILIVIAVIGVAVLFFIYQGDNPGDSSSYAWISIVPVQCGGNPWQRDSALSKGVSEPEVIKTFYQDQGIKVFDVVSKPTHEAVCLACSCPRGDTLYLSVLASDISQMLEQGFVPAEVPEK